MAGILTADRGGDGKPSQATLKRQGLQIIRFRYVVAIRQFAAEVRGKIITTE